MIQWGFPDSSVGKGSSCNAGDPQLDSWVRKIHWRRDRLPTPVLVGFPCGSASKESACNVGDLGLIPGLGRAPGEEKGYPLRYSGLENSMDCIVMGLQSWTQLSDFHSHYGSVNGILSLSNDLSTQFSLFFISFSKPNAVLLLFGQGQTTLGVNKLYMYRYKDDIHFKKDDLKGEGAKEKETRKKEERKASKHLLSTYYLPDTVHLGFTNFSVLLTLVQNNFLFYEWGDWLSDKVQVTCIKPCGKDLVRVEDGHPACHTHSVSEVSVPCGELFSFTCMSIQLSHVRLSNPRAVVSYPTTDDFLFLESLPVLILLKALRNWEEIIWCWEPSPKGISIDIWQENKSNHMSKNKFSFSNNIYKFLYLLRFDVKLKYILIICCN